MPFCRFEKLASLSTLLLCTPRCRPQCFTGISVGGSALSIDRVLGLALEQALIFYLGCGSFSGSCSMVVFHNVTAGWAHRAVAVPLAISAQVFIHAIARRLFRFLVHMGFSAVGADVPYRVYGGAADGSSDLAGVFLEGGQGPRTGTASVELFITQGGLEGRAVSRKKEACKQKWEALGDFFQMFILCCAHIAWNDAGGEASLVAFSFWLWERETDSWAQLWEDVEEPVGVELTALQRAFARVMAGVPKLQHKSNGRRMPIYSFAHFLEQCESPLHKDVLAAVGRMRSKGVTGLKRLKVQHGSGGSRSGGKKGAIWCATREVLQQCFRHMRSVT